MPTLQQEIDGACAAGINCLSSDQVQALLLYNMQAGRMAVISAEFTRPNNVTTYAIFDVVGDGAVMTFQNAGRSVGGNGYITNIRVVKNSASNAILAVFRLWLYGSAPTPIADNSPFTLLYANRAKQLGYIDLAMSTEGTGSDACGAFQANINLKFQCEAASRDLYGVLEARLAYIPQLQEKFWVELTLDQN